MSTAFIEGRGGWTEYRTLPDLVEVDLHWNDLGDSDGFYRENMGGVGDFTLDALRRAYEDGMQHVLFTHGHSTSRRGKTTARSIVRGLMRSKKATPYIIRSKSIQHYSVFVAALRPNPQGRKEQEIRHKEQEIRLREEWLFLCKRYFAIVDKRTDSMAKERSYAFNYPKYLEEEVSEQSERNPKLLFQITNYEDQYRRRVGIFAD